MLAGSMAAGARYAAPDGEEHYDSLWMRQSRHKLRIVVPSSRHIGFRNTWGCVSKAFHHSRLVALAIKSFDLLCVNIAHLQRFHKSFPVETPSISRTASRRAPAYVPRSSTSLSMIKTLPILARSASAPLALISSPSKTPSPTTRFATNCASSLPTFSERTWWHPGASYQLSPGP